MSLMRTVEHVAGTGICECHVGRCIACDELWPCAGSDTFTGAMLRLRRVFVDLGNELLDKLEPFARWLDRRLGRRS